MAVGKLARLGFADPSRVVRLLTGAPGLADPAATAELLPAVGDTADPDAALLALVRILEAAAEPDELARELLRDATARDRLLAVLGSSVALADHLVRRPGDCALLARAADAAAGVAEHRRELLAAVGADPAAANPRAASTACADDLRVAYRRRLLAIAARDLTGGSDLQATAAELSDLAAATLDAALAVARAELPADGPDCRLAVIAMGKCGGRELNYVSDVDVIFVAEPAAGADEGVALRTANFLAAALMRICSATTGEGTIWPVDANLRPEGKNGPLVRTVASHRAYYERWAKTWEFQALLKARPVAGDGELGEAYLAAVLPLVWQAGQRPDFVTEVQQMRRRVEAHVPRRESGRQLKLGPGGLRDVEFSVQLLQLVHGRADDRLRSGNTLEALGQLSEHGYVGRDDAAELDAAYRFLRTMEHRLQLHKLRRTHVVPEAPDELRRLARSLGFRSDPVGELTAEWRRHAREVRRLHEKLFYRPLLHAVARLAPEESRLTPHAARARLEALGYVDPVGALRHIEALTAGVSRRAAIQRTLLPVLLGWFANAPAPDAGLLAFRQVSDALGATHWYLRLLRDEGAAAERMAAVLASSRYAAELLLRAPEAVAILGNDEELRPREVRALEAEVLASVGRYQDRTEATAAARAVRRRELFRVAVSDLLGLIDVDEVG
ncbi:MAG: bifunctional [glutamine synthetase] adenylyltransferase/[glutamine synthetase]-adenylyl-L-tyrosine phosphorylase, partial [Actinomycetota bacterium]|nr:bifunctional [glutamine synthetase] adenylyltransferase/[glutamine synthetase]-adenylyl-L-tyrosine phosphorylase [Actinomycetota bacterium]